MKNIIILYFALVATSVFGQGKLDNIWLFGYNSTSDTLSTNGNIKIDFSTDSVQAKRYYTPMFFEDTGASICDSAGHLLFYTNGIYIADSTNQPMLGGEELYTNTFINSQKSDGAPLPQNIMILPQPGSERLYYVIYNSLEYSPDFTDVISKYLYYSVVDMSLNNGKGKVITKNQVLIDNIVFDTGNMTAVRHANGRDWWMVIGKQKSSIQYRFLISPKGITQLSSQDLPPNIRSGLGQACFSPDGTKYAKFNAIDIGDPKLLDIYNFDRCSGLLSNHIQITFPDSAAGGLAFSPNSRFLYVPMFNVVYQFDMQATNIAASKDSVAVYDGFQPPEFPIHTRFYLAQLAPDNKIYISCTSGAKYLHVIQNPDLKGKACNVTQHSFKLPTYNYNTMPNYPYFRLGKMAGVCDSVVAVEEVSSKWQGKVYPNPAQDILHLEYPTNQNTVTSEVVLFDIAGKVVLKATLPTENTVIDVRSLPTGLYLCKISDTRGGVWYEKVSVVRYP